MTESNQLDEFVMFAVKDNIIWNTFGSVCNQFNEKSAGKDTWIVHSNGIYNATQ